MATVSRLQFQLKNTPNNNASSSSVSSPSEVSPSSFRLIMAAKAGMFVKLHVNDGCNIAEGIDIPMKNLLVVDSKTEILSNKTSYTILRHCALSELFKYAPNRTIPNYALKNFVTRFTYYQNEQNQLLKAQQVPVLPGPYVIENSDKLTKILEDATIHHLMDDNDNILLHVHCEFINNFHINEAERMRLVRKEATLAADHAIKTLREWIEKAGIFLSTAADAAAAHHANTKSGAICKLDVHDDFVVVPPTEKNNKNKTNKAKIGHSPSDWAHRFIQVLLLPEGERTTSPATRSKSTSTSTSTTTTTWNQKQKKQVKTIRHNALDVDDDDLLAEYEETIMILTVSVFKGWKRVSNFVKKTIKNNGTSRRSSSTNTTIPDLVRDDSSNDEEIEEQGVEIIYDDTEIKYDADTCNHQNVVFFSESMDDEEEEEEEEEDEVVMITNPCEVDVISVPSSCESADELSFDELSFEDISDDVKEVAVVTQVSVDNDSDDEWAMLSDDDDF